jgi:hypothetical protein
MSSVMLVRCVALFVVTLSGTPALAGDPYPPQLNVSFLAEPAPIVQDGATKLVYEMLITNISPRSYFLDSIEARAGDTLATFAAETLGRMIARLGAAADAKDGSKDASKDGSVDRTIEPGRSFIVFLMLDLGKQAAPHTIAHWLHVLDDKGQAHEVTLAPLAVSGAGPIVVAAPLRGAWVAGDSVSDAPDAAHRRAVLVEDGHAWLAQRFAIDWVQIQTVDGTRTTWKGPEDRNESYFCYDQPIYSVAAGTVVAATDGAPENVPHSQKYAITIDANNAAGNHAVVEIAPQRYVLYAHMRPGTVKVKAGDRVEIGSLIGHVGNTGSSAEPHLHMHIDDHPSFLAGNGVPYEFAKGEASGPVEADVSSPTAIHFGPVGPLHPFENDYPAANALVVFK